MVARALLTRRAGRTRTAARLGLRPGLVATASSPELWRVPAREPLPPHIGYASKLQVLVTDCDGASVEILREADPVTGRQAVGASKLDHVADVRFVNGLLGVAAATRCKRHGVNLGH